MSSYVTHFICGATGGLALTHLIEPTSTCVDIGALCAPEAPIQHSLLVLASGFAALLPDIDEPHSWVGQRVRWTTTIVVGMLLALLGWALTGLVAPETEVAALPLRVVAAVAGVALGMGILGPIAGSMLLETIRAAAGGHRRLTHSLVVSLPLALVALILWVLGLPLLALVPGILAWGQWLHLVGDVVTVSGVPLWFPLSEAKVRVLPESLARVGEPIVLTLALALGVWLSWPTLTAMQAVLVNGAGW